MHFVYRNITCPGLKASGAACLIAFSFLQVANAQTIQDAPLQMTQDAPDARANDVYSPKLIYQIIAGQKTLVMYFGGWYQTDSAALPNDSIYRAVCTAPNACGLAQKVIDPVAMQMGSASMVNDPTIVELHNNGLDYLVMYMTGVTGEDRNDAATVQNNKIYYSVSWATDGIHWSIPKLLFDNGWLPSATVNADGDVILYANTNWNNNPNFLSRCNLGPSGIAVAPCEPVITSQEKLYINVDVTYQKELHLFQMLAQDSTGSFNSGIDYLDSNDGLVWEVRAENVVAQGMTPTIHPDTACWVYYGYAPVIYQADIFLKVWC
jgi:hypothetical protein